MALDPLSIEIDIRAKDVAAEQVLNDERRDVALATARVLGCPSIVFVCRVEAPGLAYRMLEARKSDHSKTLTESKLPPGPAFWNDAVVDADLADGR
jgi:hypothetical protein